MTVTNEHHGVRWVSWVVRWWGGGTHCWCTASVTGAQRAPWGDGRPPSSSHRSPIPKDNREVVASKKAVTQRGLLVGSWVRQVSGSWQAAHLEQDLQHREVELQDRGVVEPVRHESQARGEQTAFGAPGLAGARAKEHWQLHARRPQTPAQSSPKELTRSGRPQRAPLQQPQSPFGQPLDVATLPPRSQGVPSGVAVKEGVPGQASA